VTIAATGAVGVSASVLTAYQIVRGAQAAVHGNQSGATVRGNRSGAGIRNNQSGATVRP
jgi:hypothetical protein